MINNILGCIYGWSTITDHISPMLKDPVRSYFLPKMLFFYWMSSKGGSNVIYNHILSRLIKTNTLSVNFTNVTEEPCASVPEYSESSEQIEAAKVLDQEENLDDSMIESLQKSDHEDCEMSENELYLDDHVSNSVDETLSSSINEINPEFDGGESEDVVPTDQIKSLNVKVDFIAPLQFKFGDSNHASKAAE